jgi:hypothetical protein
MDNDDDLLLLVLVLLLTYIPPRRRSSSRLHREPRGPALLVEWKASPDRMREQIGCSPDTLVDLVDWVQERSNLRGSRHMEVQEKLAIFLYICRHGCSYTVCDALFARGKGTISRSFNEVLKALKPLHKEVIKMPTSFDSMPRIIAEKKQYKYFENCVGALDGTHIPISIPIEKQSAWRNRKGWLSQNVFAACSFDLKFQSVHAGWEGSAHDALVLKDALAKRCFLPPIGKYWLADAGFYNCDFMMTPYPRTRYHLKEWDLVDWKPENKEELFNLRHASLRNAIERIFGIFKRRFQIMKKPTELSIEQQVDLVIVLTALFNFISNREQILEVIPGFESSDEPDQTIPTTPAPSTLKYEKESMKTLRDSLATEMWHDYQAYLAVSNISL